MESQPVTLIVLLTNRTTGRLVPVATASTRSAVWDWLTKRLPPTYTSWGYPLEDLELMFPQIVDVDEQTFPDPDELAYYKALAYKLIQVDPPITPDPEAG